MLAAARPPSHLPGILASFLEASVDNSIPFTELSNQDSFSSSPSSFARVTGESDSSSPSSRLVSYATSALASLASLYGGEYCRTALSAAGLRGFATALGRSCFGDDSSASSEQRKSARLLLRILRRLLESDSGCAQRMISPASNQLHSALTRLKASRGAWDSATTRLADALLDKLHQTPALGAAF